MEQAPLTSGRIAADLRALGLQAGALVMVHASLRRIGPVEGGAEGVIRAILEAIGEEGTMLIILGAADDHAWVNARPEEERAALLADAVPFDATVTPADPEVGTLAEVFRSFPGSLVSDLLTDYLAAGRAREGTVGLARSELLDAGDIVAYGTRWMDEHLPGEHREVAIEAMLERVDAAVVRAEIDERGRALARHRATGLPVHELERELETLEPYRRPR